MKRLIIGLLVSTLFCVQAFAMDKAAVKKLADAYGQAYLKGDAAKIIEAMHPAIVVELGGGGPYTLRIVGMLLRPEEKTGRKFTSLTVGDPGDFVTKGGRTYAILPTTVEMSIPNGKSVWKSYLLAVSGDEGKTWKFAEGGWLRDQEKVRRMFPDLPADLKLPALENGVETLNKK